MRQLFELCGAGQTEKMAAMLVDRGQHLAALLVANPVRHREIFAALDAHVVAGELDPAMVGTAVWALTSNSSLVDLEPGSPIWRGIPACACPELERAGPPPDRGVDDAWARALHSSANTPSDTLGSFALALTRTSGLQPITVERTLDMLSTDMFDYPYALVIVILAAVCYCRQRMHMPEPARTRCTEALARARGAPPPRVPLVLPPVII